MTAAELQSGAPRPFFDLTHVGRVRPLSEGVDTAGPLFAVGDRVRTRWGRATVERVHERPYFSSPRSYHVRHDWVDSPPGFGHQFGENEMEPAGPEPTYDDDVDEPWQGLV